MEVGGLADVFAVVYTHACIMVYLEPMERVSGDYKMSSYFCQS